MAYRCTRCGKIHEDIPHIGTDRPDVWWDYQDEPQQHRIALTEDTCILDEVYFIRGVIEIPVHGEEHAFGFGVWVTQKRENFETYLENFHSADIGPFFGWLSTQIDVYPTSTLNLKTTAHFRGGRLRPYIHVHDTDHPLAREQRDGITRERAWEIVHLYERLPSSDS